MRLSFVPLGVTSLFLLPVGAFRLLEPTRCRSSLLVSYRRCPGNDPCTKVTLDTEGKFPRYRTILNLVPDNTFSSPSSNGADPAVSLSMFVSTLPEIPEIPEPDILSQSYVPPSPTGVSEQLSPDDSDMMRSVVESVIGNWRDRYADSLAHFRNAPRSPGSAPTLAEYIRRGDFNVQAVIDKLENLRGLNVEYFRRVMADGQMYLVRGMEEGESLQKAILTTLDKIPADRLAQAAQSFVTVLQTQGLTPESLQASVSALDMEELGVWYAGAVGFVSLVAASTSTVSTRKSLESKLNEATATLGKETEEANLRERKLLAEKERMESQVKDLSQATASVAKELKELKAEKAKRDYAVAEMKSELRTLKNELQGQKVKEKEVVTKLSSAEKLLQSETKRLMKELEEREIAEKILLERIAKLQSQLSTGKKQSEPAAKPEAEAQTAAEPKKTSSRQPDGVFFASVEAPSSEPVVESKDSAKPAKKTTSKRSSPSKPVAEQPDTLTVMPPKKAPAKKVATKGSDASVSGESADSPTKKSTKKVTKTSVIEKSHDDDAWTALTPAAIKRKTISELAAFLESKGISTADADGKAMKKPELLERVLKMLNV